MASGAKLNYRKSNARAKDESYFKSYITTHLRDENDVFYTTNDYLLGNSANCQHTKIFFDLSDSKKLVTHFLKFQITPGSDDLVFESINGVVINTYNMQTFSKFIDLFPICVDSVSEKRKFDIEYAFDNGCSPKIKVGIQESLENPTPLASIQKTDLNWKALAALFSNMIKLSKDVHFVHNDAHLENIQVVDDRYVLIDYGRSAIDPSILRRKTEVHGRCQSLCDKNNVTSNFLKHYVKILNQNRCIQAQPVDSYMIMYDISTITMNIIKSFFNYTLKIDGNDIITPLDEKPNNIQINFTNLKKLMTSGNSNERILLPGIFVFMQYCLRINGIVTEFKEGNSQVYEINLQKLIKYGYIWHFFQYLKIMPGALKLEQIYGDLETILTKISNNSDNSKTKQKGPIPTRDTKALMNAIVTDMKSITPNMNTKIGRGIALVKNQDDKTQFVNWIVNCWIVFTGEIHSMINQSKTFSKIPEIQSLRTELYALKNVEKVLSKLQAYETGESEFFTIKTELERKINEFLNACNTSTTNSRTCIIPPSDVPSFMDISPQPSVPSFMDISLVPQPLAPIYPQSNGGKSKKMNMKVGGLKPQAEAKMPQSSLSEDTKLSVLLEAFYKDQDLDELVDQQKHRVLITKAKQIYAEYYLKEIASPPPCWVLQVMAHLDDSYIAMRKEESITYKNQPMQ